MSFISRRQHSTWFLTVLCAGLVAGVALAQFVQPISAAWAIAAGVLIIIAFSKRQTWMFLLIFVAGMAVGAWRGGLELQGLMAYSHAIGKTTTLTGRVSADPTSSKRGGQAIAMTNIAAGTRRLDGTIYVTLGEVPKLRRDDMVTVKGAITAGHGNYAAAIYDASVSNVTRPQNLALDVRDSFDAAAQKALPDPQASLGIGILVGQKTALPSDFIDALKIAGLTHIVVASGYNLTILVRFARRIFYKISKYQAALWSVVLVLGFMAITGWSASMTRAGLVAGLSLWAWYYGRKFHPVTLLLIAASVTAMVYPPYAWGDVGWALSFAAFAGVIVLAPLLQAYFYDDKKPGFISQIVLETVSAQLATLPIMLAVFGQLSVVALLSNVMILPLIPFTMLFTFVAGMGQILLPAMAWLLAWPAQILLSYMVWAVNWTASFPWAQIKWQMPAWGMWVCYAGLVAVCLYLRRVTKYDLRQVNIVE